MRKETRQIVYKTYQELTEDEQKKAIEEKQNDENFINIFYENMNINYDYCIEELFKKINENEYFYAERKKLYWNSNSQGWYYESTDFIGAYGEITHGIYSMNITDISLFGVKSAEELYGYADFYKNNEYIGYDEVKNKADKKYFLNVCKKIIEDKNAYFKELESIIYECNSYYPEEEEIIEYLIENEIEFETENTIVA